MQSQFKHFLILVIAGCLVVNCGWAQSSKEFSVLRELGDLSAADNSGQKVSVSSTFQVSRDKGRGELSVTAKIAAGWNIYSVTQKSGGPTATTIKLDNSVSLIGPFKPNSPPKIKQVGFYKVPVEEHMGSVTWTAPIRFANDVDPSKSQVTGEISGLVCSELGGCIPVKTRFVAAYGGSVDDSRNLTTLPSATRVATDDDAVAKKDNASELVVDPNIAPAKGDGFRPRSAHASVRGELRPGTGSRLTLIVTVQPAVGWHIYAYEAKDPKTISKPTLFAATTPTDWLAGKPTVTSKPIVKPTGLKLEPIQRYHAGPVSWAIPIVVPPGTKPGSYEVKGMIGLQTCTETRCDPPTAIDFTATVQFGKDRANPALLTFAKGKSYTTVAKYLQNVEPPVEVAVENNPPSSTVNDVAEPPAPPADAETFDVNNITRTDNDQHIGYILVFAFFGGFILNFMPCVLPVVGLKILAFVQQAGESRARTFLLNVWYSIGLLSIFWVLATLAAVFSLGWGEQFSLDAFNIPLVAIVFVMGLSFLGVWEIPIPGFAGGAKASELAAKEGYAGAFVKGVITTILATPCSGPGLATALAWCAVKPPVLVYLVFTTIGLGMAFPYLLIGAFPRLVRFIPKPGAWMDTFKQLMGFVLLGTVVFMFTFIDWVNFVPALALLFGLWGTCWWVGRIPITSDGTSKAIRWAGGLVFAVLIGWIAFAPLKDKMTSRYERTIETALAGQTFTEELNGLIDSGHTVMVDFTADW